MKRQHLPISTPWGRSDSLDHIAEGLDFYSTPGHGGLKLSAARWRELSAAFQFKSFAGPGWLEEDCDYSFAVIRWPELFGAETVFNCVRMVGHPLPYGSGDADNFEHARAWLNTPAGQPARDKAASFAASVAGQWESGGMGCDGSRSGWLMILRRGADTVEALFPDYPVKRWYTDAELVEPMARADALRRRQARAVLAAEEKKREADEAVRRAQGRILRDCELTGALGADGCVYSDADPGL